MFSALDIRSTGAAGALTARHHAGHLLIFLLTLMTDSCQQLSKGPHKMLTRCLLTLEQRPHKMLTRFFGPAQDAYLTRYLLDHNTTP